MKEILRTTWENKVWWNLSKLISLISLSLLMNCNPKEHASHQSLSPSDSLSLSSFVDENPIDLQRDNRLLDLRNFLYSSLPGNTLSIEEKSKKFQELGYPKDESLTDEEYVRGLESLANSVE